MSRLRWPGATGIVFAVAALAASIAPANALSTAEKADVAKAEAYLNDVTTLKARFLQVSPAGATVEGTIYLSRPGHMRLDYDPPSPIEVIADGRFLIYYDKQLQQTTYLGLSSSPAGVLVRPHVQLDADDLKVAAVSHAPGVLNVTVFRPKEADQGKITLVFTESPFALKQWRVIDPQGQMTTVSLFAAQRDMALDKDLFSFKDPRFTNSPDLSTGNR